ncbi:DUF2577 domain-containing protein [Paenibacillus dakarensis]|uniref:DUF2577 domain-containing protein n=1 Tax=Paenibacillus dakarensis TaxID=1527293 RepID=UPI0006D5B4B0|nr:DUF2577 domain-containing protein [Paenibacillus dakarensis]
MKPELIEGGGYSQFKAMVKALGHNRDVDIEFATVVSASPLRIKIDNMPLELDEDDFAVCEHLTEHTRKATISGGEITLTTTQAGDPAHTHKITAFTITDADVKMGAALTKGDRVVVASYNSGQGYVVLDRIGGV